MFGSLVCFLRLYMRHNQRHRPDNIVLMYREERLACSFDFILRFVLKIENYRFKSCFFCAILLLQELSHLLCSLQWERFENLGCDFSVVARSIWLWKTEGH